MKTEAQQAACSETPLWEERVDAVPRPWFEALTENPRRLPLESLPFGETERQHLAQCATCRAAALDALERRAQLRWMVLCPDASEISAWLRGGTNADLEAHLRACKLCAAQTQRTAWLAHGTRLLSRKQVEAKLGVFAELWEAFVAWLVEYYLFTGAAWRLLGRGRRAAWTTKEELQERLAGDDSVTLARAQADVRWLLAQRQGDRIIIQAGASAAAKRKSFRLVFRCGTTVVHTVATRDGRLPLKAEDLALARHAGADEFDIEVVEE
jgi:hypothetical protein